MVFVTPLWQGGIKVNNKINLPYSNFNKNKFFVNFLSVIDLRNKNQIISYVQFLCDSLKLDAVGFRKIYQAKEFQTKLLLEWPPL